MKTVLAFGAFDGLHEGHRSFISQAKKLADRLVVCLAQDEVIEMLKGKAPKRSFNQRNDELRTIDLVDDVVPGDRETGSFECVTKVSPDIIALGYDQKDLGDALRTWLESQNLDIALEELDAFKPETYKSSKLNPDSNPNV